MVLEKKGTIYVVGTPIGNLGDITLRALETLRKVDVVVAEDTRRTLKLLNYYDIKKPLISYHKFNERKRVEELKNILKSGKDIAVVSDAGMPAISDPGKELLNEAWSVGINVVVVPGVSAVTAALSLSGFDGASFVFYGFPPSKGKKRREFFRKLSLEKHTIVLFESPQRFLKTLKDILNHLGNRNLLVARELTKVHEEIFRGSVKEALKKWNTDVKGEITVIIEVARNDVSGKGGVESSISEAQSDLRGLLKDGLSTRDAVKEVTEKYSLPKSVVYEEALKISKES